MMYALIYDEHEPSEIAKKVLSVHETRAEAEKALEDRQHSLKRRVWDCNARIVWVEKQVRKGEFIPRNSFSTWRPGEEIPEGELGTDSE
jgi:sialic acid synthase SpsE